jgi:hypothetical protein
MNLANLLLRHGFVHQPTGLTRNMPGPVALATVMMNLSYYGFALNVEAFKAVSSSGYLAAWWSALEPELKEITGASRKIGDFVVYKNFPSECLNKTEAEYWIPQILMYWGLPSSLFTDPVEPRPKMAEQPKCKVLRLATPDTAQYIATSLLASPTHWKEEEWTDLSYLVQIVGCEASLGKIAFKENTVRLAVQMMQAGLRPKLSSATDVLRLAAGLSDGDISLRTQFRFKSFTKPERRFMLDLLEGQHNLGADMARRPELWKRLVHQLHPGDWKRQYSNVCGAVDQLYNDRLVSANSYLERLLAAGDSDALVLLSARPGEFRRRLVHCLQLFGNTAAKTFVGVADQLTTYQLLALKRHLETANSRKFRVFPPKGNWTKMQIKDNDRPVKHHKQVIEAIKKVLTNRLPAVSMLDVSTDDIKLPSNDGEVSPYARGTVWKIPSNVDFIRTASYWKVQEQRYTWFDNGWNFFDKDWHSVGACCWSASRFPEPRSWMERANTRHGAIFSGDPCVSTGTAAQMIDLYPDVLRKQGVRYAVWGILCYSGLKFSDAIDVFAAFQWGENANTGKLFEPSRCQLALPLTGDTLSKYVVMIDLETMELMYLDANLHSSTGSAEVNGATLEKNMPAFLEYVNALPSVHDMFKHAKRAKSGIPVLYSDKNKVLNDVDAYVFRPENQNNKFKSVDLNGLLQD